MHWLPIVCLVHDNNIELKQNQMLQQPCKFYKTSAFPINLCDSVSM